MSDFTSEELQLIGESLELHYDAAVAIHEKDKIRVLFQLRVKVANLLGGILDQKQKILDSMETHNSQKVELVVGDHYRVIDPDNSLDGQRVKLEIIHKIDDRNFIRTWVMDALLRVVEVPFNSLERCE